MVQLHDDAELRRSLEHLSVLRQGGFAAGSTYTVLLHFAETYWSQAGQRVSKLILNGTTVLPNFDSVAAAGAADKAVVDLFSTAANSSGQILIQFSTVKDNA